MGATEITIISVISFNTRMYSSRMRTVHCSIRLLAGVSARGDVCPGGDVYLPGGVSPAGGGVSAQGGVCLPGGCLPAREGGLADTLQTEFLTHAYENITFPQLRLRR